MRESRRHREQANRFYAWLVVHSACHAGAAWARGKTFREAWRMCQNGDWMEWFAFQVDGERAVPLADRWILWLRLSHANDRPLTRQFLRVKAHLYREHFHFPRGWQP